jgi:hypothetical protein
MNHRKEMVLLLAIIFLSSAVTVSRVSAASPIATVKKVSGTATVIRQGNTTSAAIGLAILENDTIRTGPGGSIGIVFNDETFLSLGSESVLVIDEFVFAPKEGRFSIVITMLKGTACYLSGLISKLTPESAHFKTPTASIGIRGTKFLAKVEEE